MKKKNLYRPNPNLKPSIMPNLTERMISGLMAKNSTAVQKLLTAFDLKVSDYS